MDKVLIAEDDANMLDFIATALEDYRQQHQFEIITAKNGKEAIAILEKTPVSLLITDIRMPEVDGLDLLAYVNEKHPATPCFVMTAYKISESTRRLTEDSLILHFFPKPFKIDLFAKETIRVLKNKPPVGSWRGMTVVSFLCMIESEKKTCRFEVLLRNNKKAMFNFNKGKLFDVVYDNIWGEEAAMKAITMEKANFRFLPVPMVQEPEGKEMDLYALIEKALDSQQ